MPGPTLTGAAKMIVEAANTTTQQPCADVSGSSDAARMILNADTKPRGLDIDEAV